MTDEEEWAFENVSLWINNTERIYSYGMKLLATKGRKVAEARVMASFGWGKVTPDGAPVTRAAVNAAMADWEVESD